MFKTKTNEATSPPPLRLWPGVVLVSLQWLVRFVVPIVEPQALPLGVIGGMVGALAILVWWMFFSRARWPERVAMLVVMSIALVVTSQFIHKSIATGMMGMMFPVYVTPGLSLALVVGAVAGRRLADGPRRALMVASILIACGVWTLVRTGGFTSDLVHDFAWRWAKTPEERLLEQAGNVPAIIPTNPATEQRQDEGLVTKTEDKPAAPAPAPAAPKKSLDAPRAAKAGDEPVVSTLAKVQPEWPGFRGPNRDGIIHGVRIETDWSVSPPKELWRRPVGPGWSSFAVHGDLFYTQEQRGDDEVVACYKVSTGEPVWRHGDTARFWESNGGAGPRGTPTLSDGRVYTFGGTGILNVLDAANGAVVWSRNAASDTKAKLPYWGFASSPLVIDDLVIVATSGALIAYDLASGEQRWTRPDSSVSYSSPQLMTIGGVAQVLTVNATGLFSVTPNEGALLWEHAWDGYPIVQPARTAEGDILLSVSDKSGLRRLAVAQGSEGWTVSERWTSIGLKPYFNDFVVHKGHAFGFDGSLLACIDLEDGTRKWKGGRYGQGQLVLLADQDLLLVISEKGELALVHATSDQFTEFARFPAIASKTWNHPVLVGDVLLVRNAQEMAAFRLALADGQRGSPSQSLSNK